MTFSVLKDPDAVLDYSINWAPWLPDGDTIATSTWIVTGPDSTLAEDSSSKSTTVTTVWLSGGTLGLSYTVTNRVVTTAGRTDDRSIGLQVRQK